MKRGSLKVLLVFAIIGSLLLLYVSLAPLPRGQASNPQLRADDNSSFRAYLRERLHGENHEEAMMSAMHEMMSIGKSFLHNANFSLSEHTIAGELLAVKGRLMLVDVDGEVISLLRPDNWIVNGEVKAFMELALEGLIAEGDSLEIRALRIDVSSGEGFESTVYLAIELTDLTTGLSAEAVLPFNA